jgi:hypothetical protein
VVLDRLFLVLDLSVFSPFLPPSLCLLNIIVVKNPLSDDEVDEGILANEALLTLFTRTFCVIPHILGNI